MSELYLSAKDVSDLKNIVQALVKIDTFPNLFEWVCDTTDLELSGYTEDELFAPIPFLNWHHVDILQEHQRVDGKTFYQHCLDATYLIINFLTEDDHNKDVVEQRIKVFELATFYPIHHYNSEEHKDKAYYRNWIIQLHNCAFNFAHDEVVTWH